MTTECPLRDQKAVFEAEAQRFARYAENCPAGGFGAALKKAYLQAAEEARAQAALVESPREEGAPTEVQRTTRKEGAEQKESVESASD